MREKVKYSVRQIIAVWHRLLCGVCARSTIFGIVIYNFPFTSFCGTKISEESVAGAPLSSQGVCCRYNYIIYIYTTVKSVLRTIKNFIQFDRMVVRPQSRRRHARQSCRMRRRTKIKIIKKIAMRALSRYGHLRCRIKLIVES